MVLYMYLMQLGEVGGMFFFDIILTLHIIAIVHFSRKPQFNISCACRPVLRNIVCLEISLDVKG